MAFYANIYTFISSHWTATKFVHACNVCKNCSLYTNQGTVKRRCRGVDNWEEFNECFRVRFKELNDEVCNYCVIHFVISYCALGKYHHYVIKYT